MASTNSTPADPIIDAPAQTPVDAAAPPTAIPQTLPAPDAPTVPAPITGGTNPATTATGTSAPTLEPAGIAVVRPATGAAEGVIADGAREAGDVAGAQLGSQGNPVVPPVPTTSAARVMSPLGADEEGVDLYFDRAVKGETHQVNAYQRPARLGEYETQIHPVSGRTYVFHAGEPTKVHPEDAAFFLGHEHLSFSDKPFGAEE